MPTVLALRLEVTFESGDAQSSRDSISSSFEARYSLLGSRLSSKTSKEESYEVFVADLEHNEFLRDRVHCFGKAPSARLQVRHM